MGIPTARPMMTPELLSYVVLVPESTPLVVTLDDPMVNEPIELPEVSEPERVEEDAEVEEEIPDVVAPVPATATEPSLMLVKVISSTSMVLSPMATSSQMTISSIKMRTEAVSAALLRLKLKPMLMLL